MAASHDPYFRLRPAPDTPADERCACAGSQPLVLVARFGPHPLACFTCNGEVAPDRIAPDPTLVDAVAAWRDVFESLLRLWLDSGEYEDFARTQLASPVSPVNKRGLALAKRLATGGPVYYWWFSDGLANACPRCDRPLIAEGRHTVCTQCLIILDPSHDAG